MMKEQEPKKKTNILVRLLALLVTLALMLGALFLVVNWDKYNLDALKRRIALRSLETGEEGQAQPFTHGGGDSISFAYLTDGVVMASTAGVHYYSFSGEQYAEEVVSMENPVLTSNGSYAAAYSAGEEELYLFHGREETFSLTLEGGGVLSARVNDSGWLAVTARGSGHKGVVTVYDSGQKEYFGVSRSTTFVVDAAVSPDCKSVALVTMGQENGRVESQLLVYRMAGEELVAQVSLGSTAVLDLEYEQDQIWLLGESSLMSVDTQTWEERSYSFGRSYLKGCSLGGDGFALLLLGQYRAGSADQALTITPEGQVSAQLDLKGQVLSFSAAGTYACLLAGGELDIYTPDLELYRTLEDTQGARYTALASNASALLADRQQAWMYVPG